ncbi:MAG: DegV family protein [Actinobacteria bacterium]|nr:DegV family protein [Actinomycetota bacterium]MCB9413785.1 DegV family protein [Actinomycetota bacterium]
MPTVAVVTDSTACLTDLQRKESGVRVVPIHVLVDGRTYLDGVDITSEEVASALSRLASVSTSKPSPHQFLDTYSAAAEAGADAILSVHLSSALSGTYDAARLAARDAPVPVEVVDSRSIAMGLGFAALNAARAVGAGADLAQASDVARRSAADSQVLFYVDTLEFLRRGGRIGKASAWLGSALRVKPLLHVVDGEVAPLEKARTANRALGRLAELALAAADGRAVQVAVQHLQAPQRAQEMADKLSAHLHTDVVVCEVGAVMGVHVGPGLVAVAVAPAGS